MKFEVIYDINIVVL